VGDALPESRNLLRCGGVAGQEGEANEDDNERSQYTFPSLGNRTGTHMWVHAAARRVDGARGTLNLTASGETTNGAAQSGY
jgi:hypothetical protein